MRLSKPGFGCGGRGDEGVKRTLLGVSGRWAGNWQYRHNLFLFGAIPREVEAEQYGFLGFLRFHSQAPATMGAVRRGSPGGLRTLVQSCFEFGLTARLRPMPDKAAWGGCPQPAAGTGLRQQPPAAVQG